MAPKSCSKAEATAVAGGSWLEQAMENRDAIAVELEMASKGCRSNLSTFCLFAQRVAWGEASKQEVEFMSRMLDIVERFEAWEFGTNDVMS